MSPTRRALLRLIVCCASALSGADGLALPRQVKQTPDVVEAYRVCESFEHLLGENLDFERAYEATFTKDVARRRAIAVGDGEFGSRGSAGVDSGLLIRAYKLRMQIFFLMMPLVSPGGAREEALFFPPDIEAVLKREPPEDARGFPAYVSQLERDVSRFRSHLERLSAEHASVAERVREFKSGVLSAKLAPPADHKVEPLRGYYRSGVLGKDEPYYQIDGCVVARDQGRMRIVGLKFFNRLF
ncbi:MAG TPA: hypothetical protein VM864_06415 [Pyrinomonadaceae bacterium]|jgi:hypothetical protein|nr:hypothetical protein [Pyrinomonadaceae bacterium]